MDAWQHDYCVADTGSTTRFFFPTIASILSFRASVSASFEWTQILSGHGYHRQYLHRFKIASTDACPCGLDVQNVRHLLTDCPRFASKTQALAAECAALDVLPLDFASVAAHHQLLDALCDVIETIVRTLKSFNS